MNPHRPLDLTLRQLEYLAAIAEHGSFGAAADAAGVSQPSLSAQVAKVEDLLGLVLFERSRPVRPTREGARVLVGVQEVLGAARRLESEARALADPLVGELFVALIPTFAPYVLPRLHPALTAAMPRLVVHWREAQTAVLEQQLLDGLIDVGVLATWPADSRLEARRLGGEPFYAVLPGPGPNTPIPLAELTRRPLLLLDEGHCLRDQTLALCARHALSPSPFQATSLATLVQLVAAGVGVTLLPACAAPMEAGRADVHLRPLVEDAGRDVILTWRRSAPPSAGVEALAAVVEAAFVADSRDWTPIQRPATP